MSTINHPTHYNAHPSGIECIDVVEHMCFNLGNAAKYCWRSDHKGRPGEDLEKAIWYIRREIQRRTTETWAPYPGDPRYLVSTQGRVRRATSEKFRKPVLIKSGYLTIMTTLEKKAVLRYLHRMVWETFNGPIAPGLQVRHRNADRRNCALHNLDLGTPKQNHDDQIRHGTRVWGEDRAHAKLTFKQVKQIRKDTRRPSLIAKDYGVTRATIERAKDGVHWTPPVCPVREAVTRFKDFDPRPRIGQAVFLLWLADLGTGNVSDLSDAAALIQEESESIK